MTDKVNTDFPSLAIGGLGGSGTRVVADLVRQLGYNIGNDLNESLDNLTFTLLFKDISKWNLNPYKFEELIEIFKISYAENKSFTTSQRKVITSCVNERQQHPREWLEERVTSLIHDTDKQLPILKTAWKEPNTHLFINQLLKYNNNIKYIHVMRHGLDMCFSNNQNQLKLWGHKLLGFQPEVTAKNSLAYWLKVHNKIKTLQHSNPDNIYLLNYDSLCKNPITEIENIITFLSQTTNKNQIKQLSSLISLTDTIGRYKNEDISFVTEADIQQLNSFGYDV